MISLVNPVAIEQVLRPTVYLPAVVALRVLGNLDNGDDASHERVVAIPVVRDSPASGAAADCSGEAPRSPSYRRPPTSG